MLQRRSLVNRFILWFEFCDFSNGKGNDTFSIREEMLKVSSAPIFVGTGFEHRAAKRCSVSKRLSEFLTSLL